MPTDTASELAQILLVEDNPGDVALTRAALEEAKFVNELHVARDGEEAMRFLRREEPFADKPRPDLVLLDLNLPRMDGREVLAAVKADPDLRRIPVVILTTSAHDEDILRAYDTHANAYITKPVDLDCFVKAAQSLENFWIGLVRLPPKD